MGNQALRAAVINLGSELTTGETVNTNAAYIARRLTGRGLRVAAVITVPDEQELAAEYARRELERDDVCIFTGGLGGTRDDIT
ncbi:MAG: molybdopterin-binding protein, partial [Spirochaetota bacterium]